MEVHTQHTATGFPWENPVAVESFSIFGVLQSYGVYVRVVVLPSSSWISKVTTKFSACCIVHTAVSVQSVSSCSGVGSKVSCGDGVPDSR